MKQRFLKHVFSVLFFSVLAIGMANAQGGKISGKVIDAGNGEGLIGVNVVEAK